MKMNKLLLIFFLFFSVRNVQAQTVAEQLQKMEEQYATFLKSYPDSNAYYKYFLFQVDSLQTNTSQKIKSKAAEKEKAAFIKDDFDWNKKKGAYFKKMDETFKYNLQEKIWTKDMIRVTYQQKAEFILKRIKAILKDLKE